jgi:type IV pilus assembly protein PilF
LTLPSSRATPAPVKKSPAKIASLHGRAALGSGLGTALRISGAALAIGGGLAGCFTTPKAEEADPRSQAILDVAYDEFKAANFRASLSHVVESLEIDEANADAAYLGALIHMAFCERDAASSDCRYEDIERYARRALQLRPDMRDARNVLGVALVFQKRFDDAIDTLKPLTQDILYASPQYAWGNLGWAYLERGDYALAVDALSRAVAAQPKFCVGRYRLGVAFLKTGKLEQARKQLTQVVEAPEPQCRALQDAWESRGQVALLQRDIEGARADFERCTQFEPETPTRRRCAQALARLGPASAPPPPPTVPPTATVPPAPESPPPASSSPAPDSVGVPVPAPKSTRN